jgi:hypothetical protein
MSAGGSPKQSTWRYHLRKKCSFVAGPKPVQAEECEELMDVIIAAWRKTP